MRIESLVDRWEVEVAVLDPLPLQGERKPCGGGAPCSSTVCFTSGLSVECLHLKGNHVCSKNKERSLMVKKKRTELTGIRNKLAVIFKKVKCNYE